MSNAGEIFRKLRLTSGQLRAVAERRLGDADLLARSQDRERANGAIYLGGFVIECLLKAALLDRHRNLASIQDPASLSPSDAVIYSLLYSHDLDEMLDRLPEVKKKLERLGNGSWEKLRSLCAEWAIYARYSPKQASLVQALAFVETIRATKSYLRDL